MTNEAGVELPPLGKISMIGIWIETVLYGANCIMYPLCIFVLLRGGKAATLRWVLVVASTIVFLLCTAHVGVSLQQLLDAFVYAPANVPDYSMAYWLDSTASPRILKDVLYDTVLVTLDLILIWRLYVVFMYNWRVIIIPIILVAGVTGVGYASSALSAFVTHEFYASKTTSLIVSGCVFDFILNVTVTGAIAIRLWWMGRIIASLTGTSTNRFASSVRIIIESGAIGAVCSTVVLMLFVSNNPGALAALDVICQVVVLTSLLIVVQASRGSDSDSLPPQGLSLYAM